MCMWLSVTVLYIELQNDIALEWSAWSFKKLLSGRRAGG